MKPFFCRTGNKYPLRNIITPIIPPHSIYVEPFVGSGAIFFSKEPSHIEIVNDLDKSVFENLNMLKRANTDVGAYKLYNTVESIQSFVDTPPKSKEEQLMKRLYLSSNTFSCKGTGKIYNPNSGLHKINKIQNYVERLSNVEIFNQDYKTIVEQYDGEDTFFFFDPPYECCNTQLYEHSFFDYNQLLSIVKNLKGKFILTLNDSGKMREIFKDFNITSVSVVGKHTKKSIGSKTRQEIIITNFIKTDLNTNQ